MFVFTITIGLTALIMAWTTVLIAFKGWALRKENSEKHVKALSGVFGLRFSPRSRLHRIAQSNTYNNFFPFISL